MNFLKSFFASILGTLTALGLFFVIVLLFISGIASIMSAPSGGNSIKQNSVLALDLNLPIVDRAPSFDELQILLGLEDKVLGLPDIISAIDKASENQNIKGIRLRADFISAGWAQTRSIRNALSRFKESGKFIYAYADVFTQKGYYLASISDSIYLNPVGILEFKGLASEVLYYKDFQDEYGVKMEVIRHGKYKSAVEPYLENEMSSDNRYQIKTLLDDIWETIREEIAQERNLDPKILDKIINNQRITIPEDGVQEHLIDALVYEDDFDEKIKMQLEISTDEDLNRVSVVDVNNASSTFDSSLKDRIAIVFARGPIMYGEGTKNMIAQGVFVETLKELAEDDWIKAVVIRVESPGGNALTSDLLWRAIEKLKTKKPVLVSMGNVAASGGYYIAAGADQIFADPLTITGSIGVFASLPNIYGMTEKIGIHAETVETHQNALGYSFFQPLTESFKIRTIKSIENTYNTFKQRVIKGRGLTSETVEALAQGRVWSGKQALSVGLVDHLGGLQDAIEAAAEVANIENYNTIDYPKFEEDLESILSGAIPSPLSKATWMHWVPENLRRQLEYTDPKNPLLSIQMLIPFDLSIE
ncbi:MAG: signal peptide peptidase SppA [Flavobacteriaceae bacterium]|jgi:protease-4|nr:signal peptide peptidase SppA [Flavobacteriaceae bacterium]MBT6954513.1 signal peptide peptidase SppA [Flavobacteriaceae bacterium]MDA7820737.1 signal peptide peptidase SppA [Flavobacteriaceae bacterium]MDA9326990.1 signal peptide peptidase SppA [Flavobacteriaceae bacterium]MDA9810863.1 signal peptide peptidase SppA [Flavobacteriaceae bacterium]